MEVIPELRELNLDDNEIKVYLSCLSLGSSKVHEIAKKSNLIRTTAYGVLRSLSEKGLVSTILKENITYFQAAEPKHLIETLEEKKNKISLILPKLEEIKAYVSHVHKVQIFEGKEGLKTIFNDFVLKENQEVKVIGFLSKWLDFFGVWTEIYYRKKNEKKVKTFVLMDEKEKKFASDKRVLNSEFRYLENLDINGECFLYEDKVILISFNKENLNGVVIQDKEIAKMQNLLFDKLWGQAKP